jgi:hypothetical protein
MIPQQPHRSAPPTSPFGCGMLVQRVEARTDCKQAEGGRVPRYIYKANGGPIGGLFWHQTTTALIQLIVAIKEKATTGHF